MKKVLYLIMLLPLMVSSQNWQWANQIGGNAAQSYDNGKVITDGTNYYLYGTFAGAMYLQTDTFSATSGNSDFYIIKYDANGNELWAKSFGGNNGTNQSEFIYGVYDVNCGCIYWTGSFWGSMVLDTFTINGGFYYNNFFAKMDLNGNFAWVKHAWTKSAFSSLFDDRPPLIATRPDGIIYLTTSVVDTAFFDTIAVEPGGCLAKYDSDGNCLFARHLFNDNIPSVNYAGLGFINKDLIMWGSYKANFTIDTASLVSNGSYDMYISRADSNGNILWINSYGNGGLDAVTWLTIDNFNNLYAATGFTDSISIDGNSFYNSSPDILLLKMDGSGNFIWGRQTNATGNIESANSIIADGDGNCYITGVFSGSATFGSYSISTSNLYEMFLTRYNNTGDCLGIRHFGQASGAWVVINSSGSPSVAGTFVNTVSIGSDTFTSNGSSDVFLAKSDIFTGIGGENRAANNQLLIYANPTADKCNITVPDEFLHDKNLKLSIYANDGKLIQQKTLSMAGDKIKLNLEAEAKGVYNVTLSNGLKNYSGKIVFE